MISAAWLRTYARGHRGPGRPDVGATLADLLLTDDLSTAPWAGRGGDVSGCQGGSDILLSTCQEGLLDVFRQGLPSEGGCGLCLPVRRRGDPQDLLFGLLHTLRMLHL